MIKTLSQCLDLVIDKRGVTPKKLNSDWKNTGYRVLSANNVKTSGIEKADEIRFIDENTYKKWMKEEVKKGDILLTSEAPAGEVYYWDSEEKIVAGQRIYVLRTNAEVNPLFLKYYIQSNKGQAEIRNKCSGSTVFGISAKTFDHIEIVLPDDRKTQDNIADTLRVLDNKIENNKDIIAELEAIINTIYDYWFLQFQFPNEDGKPYKSSGGKMIWNEELKQEIPENWSVKCLSDISEMQMKSITPHKDVEYQHYSIPSFDNNGMPVIEYGSQIDSNKYRVPSNSILVSKLNPQFKRLWNVGEVNDNCICSTEFLPFLSLNNQKEYLYSVLNSASFHKYMVQSSSSSTGSRKRMQPELCMEFKFASPSDSKLIDDYCKKVSAALDRIIENKKENQELASLRDFLLPLLMNGQVTFKEN